MGKVKDYYSLTKPGVTYGNAITAVAGYLLAAGTDINFLSFISYTIGITLIIGSACAINNYFDQDIDRLMERTKKRVLIEGKIPGRNAVIFSLLLGLLGALLLYVSANLLTVAVGLFGWFVYVFLYGRLTKRLSIHGTLVGSVSGAAPILSGWTAVTNEIGLGGVLLFLVLFFWQMPEFYSIAIYRQKEYAKAGVPVMTVVKGIKNTILQIFIYVLLFVVCTILLSVFDITGYVYGVIMSLLGIFWIWLGAKGFYAKDKDAWSRKMFRFSLVILLVFSGLISIEAFLP